MWPTVGRSEGRIASAVRESLDEVIARDPAQLLAKLYAMKPSKGKDALSPKAALCHLIKQL
jgi:hypothetical protein